MRKIFIRLKDILFSSYWFFPTGLFIFSFLLAWTTLTLDQDHKEEINSILESLFFFTDLSIATARVYLSTLVGAVITVVGVVFSLTILTVSTASRQFGPRILNNFMRDRGNQITLGVYTSTFVYTSTILISLFERDNTYFLPYLSIFISYSMALLCIAFLIYYIHHIPESLRIECVVWRIAKEAMKMIESKFPQEEKLKNLEILDSPERVSHFHQLQEEAKYQVSSSSVGYVQAVDLEGLLKWAEKNDILVEILAKPGHFINGKSALVEINKQLDSKELEKVFSFYAVGAGRTLPQNLMYLLSQLMEIATRSLSQSLNDPITAMSCIDWLEACLLKMIDCDSKYSIIHNEKGRPRALLKPLDVEETLMHMEKGLREHVARNFSVSHHLMLSLKRLHANSRSAGQRKAIESCAKSLLATCHSYLPLRSEIERLSEIFSSFSPNKLESTHEYQ